MEILERLKTEKTNLESQIAKLQREKSDLERIMWRIENDIKLLGDERQKAINEKEKVEKECLGSKAKIETEINRLNSIKGKLENDRIALQEWEKKEKENLTLERKEIEQEAKEQKEEITKLKLEDNQERLASQRNWENFVPEILEAIRNKLNEVSPKFKKMTEKVE